MNPLAWIVGLVAMGGAGAVLRWWVSARLNRGELAHTLPWGTISVNVVASFLLGVVHAIDTAWAGLVGAAFCGALSTFSTFVLELVRLVEANERRLAVVYVAISVGGGLVAVWLGLRVGELS